MFCTSCGTKNATDSNFCRQCGGKFEKLSASKISPDDFERALPEDEQTMALLERAYSLRKSGDLDGAVALCEQSLHLRSDSTSTHSLLGQLYEEKGNRAAAIGEYERVLALNPGSIADRVKLDELRLSENGSENRPHPRVLMSDSHRSPVFDTSRFTSVGVTVGLLVLGGLVAMQFFPRTTATTTPPLKTPTSTPVLTASALPNTKALDAGATTADTTKPSGDTSGKPQIGTTPIAGPPASNPIPVQYAVNPPIIYQTTPSQIRYIPAPLPSNPRTVSNVSPTVKRARTAGNNGGGNEDGSGRVMLTGDPDVADSNGKITVKVGEKDVPGKKTDKNGDNGDDANLSGKFGSAELDKSHSNGPRATPNTPTGDARSLMAMGQELKRGKDFKGAINAFTRALASAGDEAGYVYQNRALCYQNLNNAASAKADYESAIDAYHKLEAHDPETAKNGIRACQAGIKTCGN